MSPNSASAAQPVSSAGPAPALSSASSPKTGSRRWSAAPWRSPSQNPASPVAEVAVTFFVTRNDGASQAPLWSRDYQRRVAIKGAMPEAYVQALSVALGGILAELASDLAAAVPGGR